MYSIEFNVCPEIFFWMLLYTKRQKSFLKYLQNITDNIKLYVITRSNDLYAKNTNLNYFKCEDLLQPGMWPLKINSSINGV